MTKELSKELCKLCGIEPKTRYHVRIAGPVYKISKETVLKNSKIFRSPSIKVRKVTKNYPDFSNPENFVKLFGLPVKVDCSEPTETILHILTAHFHIFDDESFLCALYKYLNGYGDYKAQVIEAIREAQWVYE